MRNHLKLNDKMIATYDSTTDVSVKRVRFRIRDTNVTNALFTDEEILDTLVVERSSWKRASALCLETIATNEALILKVIEQLGLKTDGAKLADSFMKQAKVLRDQADEEDAFDDDHGLFDWAEHVLNLESEAEIIAKSYERSSSP